MATTRTLATEEDLLQTPDDGKYELVDGEIRYVSPAGARHGQVIVELMVRLHAFVEKQKLGYVLEGQTGFRIPGRGERPDVRVPDISFVAAHRIPEGLSDDFPTLAPDLAVEVVSPSNRRRDVMDKVGQLLEAGSRLVWVINPKKRTAMVYRPLTDEVQVINESGSLEGEDVIPGFSCRLSDILV